MTTMTTMTTKRHKRNFYFLLVFSFIFYVGIATLVLWQFIAKLNSGHIFEGREYLLPVVPFLLYSLAIYTVWMLFKNAPIITIDKNTIRFGSKEIYNVADIRNIVLTGKKPLKYIFVYPTEGASIEFNDGTKKYIYDDMYSNSWQLKSFLEQVVINKKDFVELNNTRIDSAELGYAQVAYYKGNQFLSFRGLLLWGSLGYLVALLFIKQTLLPTGTLIILGIFGLAWIAFNSWFMNYFGVSRDHFVIKNHNLIWQKRLYRIDNIKEVVFETRGKMPNCLRIITKDFQNSLFPACTLRNETWFELKKVLEERGIIVRNECI